MASPTGTTSVKAWKKVSQGEEVELPSGNVCLLKRPGIEALFSAGVLPDKLTEVALESINKASGKPQDRKKKKPQTEGIDAELIEKFLAKENALEDILMAADRVVSMCVVKPPVRWHMEPRRDEEGHHLIDEETKRPLYDFIPPGERDEDFLYTDDIDPDDKNFIFNFVVGGTRDIETFRAESGDALAVVQSVEDVSLSALATPEPSERLDSVLHGSGSSDVRERPAKRTKSGKR